MFQSGFDNSKSLKVYLDVGVGGGEGDSYGHTNVRTFYKPCTKNLQNINFSQRDLDVYEELLKI